MWQPSLSSVLSPCHLRPRHHREAGKRHYQPAQTDRKHSFEISQHERRLWRVFFEGLCSLLCFSRWQCVSKPTDEQQVVELVERNTPRVALTAPTERSCNKCPFCTRTSPWTVVRTQRRKFFVRTTDNSNKQTRKENKASGTGAATVQIPSVMRYMSRVPSPLLLGRSALRRTPGQTLVCQVFLTPRTLPNDGQGRARDGRIGRTGRERQRQAHAAGQENPEQLGIDAGRSRANDDVDANVPLWNRHNAHSISDTVVVQETSFEKTVTSLFATQVWVDQARCLLQLQAAYLISRLAPTEAKSGLSPKIGRTWALLASWPLGQRRRAVAGSWRGP